MIQRFNLRVTALTDIHIGGAERLTVQDYVPFSGRLHVIGPRKWREWLRRERLGDQYVFRYQQAASREGSQETTQTFLESVGRLRPEVITEIGAYSSRMDSQISTPRGEIRPFIRDAYQCPYLPGSSVKGALRTVVLYHLAKRMKQQNPQKFQERLVNPLLEKMRGNIKDKSFFDDWLEGELLSSYALPNELKKSTGDPHHDYLRVLRIGDSRPVDRDGLTVKRAVVKSSRAGGGWYEKTGVLLETVPAGMEFELSCSLDRGLMEAFQKANADVPFERPSDLLAMIKSYHDDCMHEEREFAEQVKESIAFPDSQQRPILQVGWGTGLLGVSLLPLWDEEVRGKIRGRFFKERGDAPFPKSRRLLSDATPFGWMQVEVEELER